MDKLFIIILKMSLFVHFLFLFSFCQFNPEANQGVKAINTKSKGELEKRPLVEKFDSFLVNFSSDSVFQKERIIFPLEVQQYEIDIKSYTTNVIKSNEWQFFYINGLESSYQKKIFKESDQRYRLEIQINDTGVLVSYIFSLNDKKWFLVKVIDEST